MLHKNRFILLLSFIGSLAGLILLIFSWWLSYPLTMDSPLDFVFNHVSSLYWLALPVLYVSLYVMATKLTNKVSRLIVIFSIVMVMHSLTYFYFLIPGSDSQYVRGLTEYFFKTGNLDPSKRGHSYFMWPLFFVLEKMTHLVLGLELKYLEFILYTTISFLYVAALYSYASRLDSNNAFMAVIGFFIVVQYMFEFQFVPVFASVGLLLVLLMLQTHAPKRAVIATTLVMFTSIALMHSYVAVFFIIYTLAMFVIRRRQMFLSLSITELCIYLLVLTFRTQPFFEQGVRSFLDVLSFEYSQLLTRSLAGGWAAPPTSITLISRMFSRAVTIGTMIVLGVGFILLLIRRKMRDTDYAILFSGITYASIGSMVFLVGNRAFFMIAMILSLGILYPFKKFHKYFKVVLLILLVLFTFIQVSLSFNDAQTMFQTKAEYRSANFLIDNVNFTRSIVLLSHFRSKTYVSAKEAGNAIFEHDFSRSFPDNIDISDHIFYTVGLGKSFLRLNLTEEMSSEITSRFNVVFNSGSSYIAIRANASQAR